MREQVRLDKLIDTRGSFSPEPLLELIHGIRSVAVGAVVGLRSTDPGATRDIPIWVARAGHDLVDLVREPGGSLFIVRKTH